MNRPAFGRRGIAQHGPSRLHAIAAVKASGTDAVGIGADHPEVNSVDEELRAWKAERAFMIPWKQLSLMASICFGIATFVLPDTVNRVVNWLLYGLAAVSLYIWFIGRRNRRKLRAGL